MPMNPEEFYAHAMRAADAEGRLTLSRMTGWDVFPFEQAGLRVVPLARPAHRPDRAGDRVTAAHRPRTRLPLGDGAAHLHIFFFARPAGFTQLRGTCMAIWDDLLPAAP